MEALMLDDDILYDAEDEDTSDQPWHGYHIQTVGSRRAWDKKWMAATGDTALIREIQRQYPNWQPTT